MASSLDDMEAYELLQIELDRSLQRFLPAITDSSINKAQLRHFLNSWIEYICFVRHLWVWEDVVASETEQNFLKWYEEVGGETLSLDLLRKFQESFK